MIVRLCPYCGDEIRRMGEDLIDYCPGCEVITEGETILVQE